MRTILSLCVIISAAVACPTIEKTDCHCDCDCDYPKIVPKSWKIMTFDSQHATLKFQGVWNLQLGTPTYIKGQDPLQTGLLCNTYPCSRNQWIIKDTTPDTEHDFNILYECTDVSYNLHTQGWEKQKGLLSPAYGKTSKYAVFNYCSQKYYKTSIKPKNPFIDDHLIRNKIGGICETEITITVIGGDKYFKDYIVVAVVNEYDNIFYGNKSILWVFTRLVNPKWETYQKAFKDIERSGLCAQYLVSINQSLDSLSVPSIVPSAPIGAITAGDINGVVKNTSVSTKSTTKSVVSDSSSSRTSSKTTSTVKTTTSTVIIKKSSDYTSLYELGSYNLYNNIKIIKNMDKNKIKDALYGKYYMSQTTPISSGRNTNSKVGLLNTAIPASSLQVLFSKTLTDEWDYNVPLMMMDRGYNMLTGEIQETRCYITSVYDENHPYSNSVYAVYSEGYYDTPMKEKTRLKLNGMICKQPSDIYRQRIILSILGYKENEYLILCSANDYENHFFTSERVYQTYIFTRARNPSQETMRSVTQDLLESGFNPNLLMVVDQTVDITDDYVFDVEYFQSQTSYWSSSSSSTSSSTTTISSSASSISVSND